MSFWFGQKVIGRQTSFGYNPCPVAMVGKSVVQYVLTEHESESLGGFRIVRKSYGYRLC